MNDLFMNRITLYTILLFHSVLISLRNDWKIVKYICLILVFLFLLEHSKAFFLARYRKINLAILIFCAFVFLSTIHSILHPELFVVIESVTPFSGVLFILSVIDIFFFFEYLHYKQKMRQGIKVVFYLFLIYVIIADIYALIYHPSFNVDRNYIIGNKFTLSYSNYFLVTMYYFLHTSSSKKNTLVILVLLFCCIAISKQVYCSTGVILGICYIFFFIFSSFFKLVLVRSNTLLLILIFCVSFVVVFNVILSIPIIEYVVVEILGESLTLTGRAFIYEYIFDIINRSPLLGYGCGNANSTVTYEVGFGNAQNGILQNCIQYGLVGLFGFLIISGRKILIN